MRSTCDATLSSIWTSTLVKLEIIPENPERLARLLFRTPPCDGYISGPLGAVSCQFAVSTSIIPFQASCLPPFISLSLQLFFSISNTRCASDLIFGWRPPGLRLRTPASPQPPAPPDPGFYVGISLWDVSGSRQIAVGCFRLSNVMYCCKSPMLWRLWVPWLAVCLLCVGTLTFFSLWRNWL